MPALGFSMRPATKDNSWIVGSPEIILHRGGRITRTGEEVFRSFYQCHHDPYLLGGWAKNRGARAAWKEVYGEDLIERLALDLARKFSRGFSQSNLWQMGDFYLAWPILQTGESVRQTHIGGHPKAPDIVWTFGTSGNTASAISPAMVALRTLACCEGQRGAGLL